MSATSALSTGGTTIFPIPTTTESGERRQRLESAASEIRRNVVRMISHARLGHIGGDFSASDILATLFFAVLRVDPLAPADPGRDRFILSKGHCSAALYSTLALRGFFPTSDLATFMQPLSALNGHPNRRKVAGVEANTGPLGHGLPIGVGSAIASRLSGSNWRTFVVIGDGELAGRLQLGSGDVRRPSRARHADRDRRPQPPATGRAHRGDQPPRAACRQMARLRLGHGRMRRPRPCGACSTSSPPRAQTSRSA